MESDDDTTILRPRLRHRILRGVMGNFLALIFNQGSYFLLGVMVAQFLGKDTYGQFYILQVTVLAASILGQSFCGTPLTRYLANLRSTYPLRAGQMLSRFIGISFLLALLLGGFLAIGSNSLSQLIFADDGCSSMLLALAMLVFAYVIAEAAQGALAGLERFEFSGGIALGFGLLLWGGSYWLLRKGSLEGMLWIWAALAWLRMIVLLVSVTIFAGREGVAMQWPGRERISGEVWRFAIPCSLIGLTSAAAPWLMATFLLNIQGEAQSAVYGAAVTLRQMILLFPAILNGVILSLLNHRKAENIASAKRLYHWTFGVVFVSSVLMTLGIWLFGPCILKIFGKSFQGGEFVLLLLAFSAIPMVLANTFNQIILSQEKIWILFFAIALPRDLLLVGLSWWSCTYWGVIGLATLNLIVCILVFFGMFLLTRRIKLDNITRS